MQIHEFFIPKLEFSLTSWVAVYTILLDRKMEIVVLSLEFDVKELSVIYISVTK